MERTYIMVKPDGKKRERDIHIIYIYIYINCIAFSRRERSRWWNHQAFRKPWLPTHCSWVAPPYQGTPWRTRKSIAMMSEKCVYQPYIAKYSTRIWRVRVSSPLWSNTCPPDLLLVWFLPVRTPLRLVARCWVRPTPWPVLPVPSVVTMLLMLEETAVTVPTLLSLLNVKSLCGSPVVSRLLPAATPLTLWSTKTKWRAW